MRRLAVRLWHDGATTSGGNPLIRPHFFCASAQAGTFSRREKAMEPRVRSRGEGNPCLAATGGARTLPTLFDNNGLRMPPLKIATQMDPIAAVDIRGDSTFALLLEAQRRGHQLFYYTPPALSFREGALTATGHDLTVRDTAGDFFTLSAPRTEDLTTQDVVLLRQDPPFDMSYITSTHLLGLIHPKTLVVNDPRHVRNAPEKLGILEFGDLIPPTLVTRDPAEIAASGARTTTSS